MSNHEASAPREYTSDDYPHPLFAKIQGEVVSLEGHRERGVTAVLQDVLDERGLSLTEIGIVELVDDPDDLVDSNDRS